MPTSPPASRRLSTRDSSAKAKKSRSQQRRRRGKNPRRAGKSRLGRRSVDKKERRRNAAPPFTTSKLQQDASRKLRFSVKRTMMIAQRLTKVSNSAKKAPSASSLICVPIRPASRPKRIAEVREYVGKEYGPNYLPEPPNTFKEKKDAQAAHEAIRPTSAMRHPDQIKQYLKEDEFKVYKLIWQRFVASQIMPAVFDQTTVDIDAKAAMRLLVPRHGLGAEIRWLPESL